MVSLANVVINAISISSLYAIIAIGFTLIFGVGGVLNFSHGALITIGAEASWLISGGSSPLELGLNPAVGLIGGMITAALVSGALYLGVVRFVEDEPVTLLILTFIIGFFIQHACRVFLTGTGNFSVDLIVGGSTNLGGIGVQNISVFIFVLSMLLVVLTGVFVSRTKTGKAILAVSMSDKGAAVVGIDARKINLVTWLLAGAFAGIAGVLLTMKNTGTWTMGTQPLILAFSIVILGGLGSIKGSVVGAYIIGFTETITTQYIDSSLQGFSALVLLIVFLLVKPEGLFGREAAE
ncbi:branched-chain amino acid ABC transporter permease [Haloglomus halophilum]|uniref:branched-chain amino acid ABC transporter permease n=1 Tax=Haloglomus halophilum TaxID=2962672 RepID=UPI0020C97031|nr:branched-chain amino acid ABC transporter permease [Haloglomus halophilum]